MGYLRGFTHESVWGWVKANMATHAGEAFHKLPGQISTLSFDDVIMSMCQIIANDVRVNDA